MATASNTLRTTKDAPGFVKGSVSLESPSQIEIIENKAKNCLIDLRLKCCTGGDSKNQTSGRKR